MENYKDKAKKIFGKNIFCVIATATAGGKPWISPVYFNYDDKYNIYWESNRDAQHSKYVRANKRVAIVIFDSHMKEGKGTQTGVYVVANAHEVKAAGLPEAIKFFYGGRHTKVTKTKPKKPEEYMGSKPLRLYKQYLRKFLF
ncbi:pyridoxamine 5'-phosphate oxidase family protein [Candidatus Curtissbacteria bacterium]|nr:pyridoxamine 5'-phosphate oxidase family protein [Candidatus Curtissbacteria bacterium]